jgi:flagellar hook assembly protein FlgD
VILIPLANDDETGTPQVKAGVQAVYPNPFNPVTHISYFMPKASDVNLSIYNLRGEQISVLQQGRQTAGMHNITWNGKNSSGQNVGSGVYFLRLQMPGENQTRKLILLK